MDIVQHEHKTAGTTAATVLNFTDVPSGACTFYFTITNGSVRLGTSAANALLSKTYTSADVVPPFSGTNNQIWFIANENTDTFVGTAIPQR